MRVPKVQAMVSLMSGQSVAYVDWWVWPAMDKRNIAAR